METLLECVDVDTDAEREITELQQRNKFLIKYEKNIGMSVLYKQNIFYHDACNTCEKVKSFLELNF